MQTDTKTGGVTPTQALKKTILVLQSTNVLEVQPDT